MVKSVVPNDEIADEVYLNANGNARTVSKTLKIALRSAKTKQTAITKNIVIQSRRMLIA